MSFFDVLWRRYPTDDPCDAKDEQGEILLKNPCAMRLSDCLHKAGVSLISFPSNRECWVHKNLHEVLAAKERADWLETFNPAEVGKVQKITGKDWREKILNKKGIICFEDYSPASNGSGSDRIDLWGGNTLTGLGSWLRTRFNIVVLGFCSDFRKSKKIRFYEVF